MASRRWWGNGGDVSSTEVEHEQMGSAGTGLTRRDLIRRSAVAAGVAWSAPVIVDSLVRPAGALTPGPGFPCSYITVVFEVDGTRYAAKFAQGSTGACQGNTTSGDETFTTVCNGVTYSNTGGGGNGIHADGVLLPSYPGSCGSVLTVSGRTITARADVTILFALAHDGSYSPKMQPVCPPPPAPGNSVTAPDCGKGG